MTKQATVVEVIPASVPVLGIDLAKGSGAQIEAAMMAREKFKRSKKVRVIQAGEVDWSAEGARVAELVLGIEEEVNAAIKDIRHQQRVSKGTAWLSVAMELDKASNAQQAITTIIEAYGAALEAKGSKRTKVEKSEFKLFLMAYLVSPTEVMGVLDEMETTAEAMTELRAIRDTGKPSRAQQEREPRKPGEKSMSKIIDMIGRMDSDQCARIIRIAQARFDALNKPAKKTKK